MKLVKGGVVSWEKFGNQQKSPEFQRVPKTKEIMTHFHLMRTQKHKILSIVVLNMAKYTIISLILIDFVPIFFILNLFERICRGHSTSKNPKFTKKKLTHFEKASNLNFYKLLLAKNYTISTSEGYKTRKIELGPF